ncbi:MAG: tetratricopeptide repeat protein [Proteobacteria bacterium]|nr:tetratricopeptide repeat protein [Pseudomonadota bacterium]
MKLWSRLVLVAAVLVVGAAGPATAMISTDPPASHDKRLVEAEKLVKAKEYAKAIPLLDKVVADNPKDVDAYSYLGYSHRKLGDRDKGFKYYQIALGLDPNHKGTLEYLGELYLELNDLPKAEELLARLAKICNSRCEEYRDLRKDIEAFKAAKPKS